VVTEGTRPGGCPRLTHQGGDANLPVCHAGNALLRIFILQNRVCGAPACPIKFRRTAKRILVGCTPEGFPCLRRFFGTPVECPAGQLFELFNGAGWQLRCTPR